MIKKIYVNIDGAALNRKPFVEQAALLWRLAEQKEITACLSNTSITDIFYIINKYAGQEKARSFIADIPDTFKLVDIDEEGFREALNSDMNDSASYLQHKHPNIRQDNETNKVLEKCLTR
ncbi:MAG: hypothetical protein ACD_75C02645G0011 [uncultured bacterium]|nr:MAG: hypothetical protein ACD_75C02645G0011 [uncultured bacterium]